MQTLIAILALAAMILLIIGLIRPRWAFLRARWQVLIAYPAALTVLGIVASVLMPPDELAAIRGSRVERPRKRVIFVSKPLSSIKTNAPTSRSVIPSRHRARASTMSSRSCSQATSVFFCA
ncbi:hypothetical protein GGD89_003881 [Roseospira visakhapatnamensis]|uniref:Uncharacterized protein n=1 Tax=Roseospira visakhapatnamensis TaxID=390880 RepID=A0A7W6WBV3_9PROT|nr:hypothetical protein [Roseospira visakhapatnamensis]